MKHKKQLSLFVIYLILQLQLFAQTQPENYVFFNLERESIRNPSFYNFRQFAGAQLKYTWKSLEREKDVYDFSAIEEDKVFLLSKGKKLFIQIQDVSFSSNIRNVPNYIIEDPQYHGGINLQYGFSDDNDNNPKEAGWVARRWDRAVAERFHKLLMKLGKQFDGKIAGITLPETSVDFGSTGKYYPVGFTPEIYRDAIKANMNAAHLAFKQSVVIQYANFMPGEWLPWDDKGYLSSLFEYAESLHIGMGGPDLIPYKRNQMNHGYNFARKYQEKISFGFAVQEGNYGQINERTQQTLTIEDIYNFGKSYLGVDYIFWYPEEPYFTRNVKPLLIKEVK
jgi:hypothetical protein